MNTKPGRRRLSLLTFLSYTSLNTVAMIDVVQLTYALGNRAGCMYF